MIGRRKQEMGDIWEINEKGRCACMNSAVFINGDSSKSFHCKTVLKISRDLLRFREAVINIIEMMLVPQHSYFSPLD